MLNVKASVFCRVNVKDLCVVVSWIFLAQKFEFECQCVDLDLVFACIVLLNCRQKALCEEETRQPKHFRSSLFVNPLAKCIDAER